MTWLLSFTQLASAFMEPHSIHGRHGNMPQLLDHWQARLYPLRHAAAHYVHVSKTLFRQ
jgi:hypothetical protein